MSWSELGKSLFGAVQTVAAAEFGEKSEAVLAQLKRGIKAIAIAVVTAIFLLHGLAGALAQLFAVPEYTMSAAIGAVLFGLLYLYTKRSS